MPANGRRDLIRRLKVKHELRVTLYSVVGEGTLNGSTVYAGWVETGC